MHGNPGRLILAGRRSGAAWLAAFLLACGGPALAASLPQFQATALTGHAVRSEQLLGRPTLLIVTPSRQAAPATRAWVKALRKKIDPSRYHVRDVLAIDLPFFLSEQEALRQARKKIPSRYHDRTWLLDSAVLEKQLGIPRDSTEAYLLVLDRNGRIVARVHGSLSPQRMETIVSTLTGL